MGLKDKTFMFLIKVFYFPLSFIYLFVSVFDFSKQGLPMRRKLALNSACWAPGYLQDRLQFALLQRAWTLVASCDGEGGCSKQAL